jgi:hypothetical protein
MNLASFFGENKSACRAGMCAGDPECPDKYCEGLGGGNYWPREQAQVMPAVEEVEAWVGWAAVIVAVALFVLVVAVMLT